MTMPELKSPGAAVAHHGIESRTFASAEGLLGAAASRQRPACCSTSTSEEFRGSNCSADLRDRIEVSRDLHDRDDNEATRNEAMDAGCIA